MKTSYKPQADSVAFKTIEYLTTNPDEELTSSDVGIKFDRPSKQVHSLLAEAVKAGALKRETNADDELVYRLGTGVPEITPNHSANPSLRGAAGLPSFKPARPKRELVQIDCDAIKLDSEVPLPAARGVKGPNWEALLLRMTAGQSCQLPRRARPSLTKVAKKLKDAGSAEFAFRAVAQDEFRVWRVK